MKNPPALLSKTCRCEYLLLNSSANLRISCCDDRSASRQSTFLFPLAARISSTSCVVLDGLRPTITTVPPICASAWAVTLPMPLVAPVTRQILPFILSFNVSFLSCCLFLSARPRSLEIVGQGLVRFSCDVLR